jgi:hypothetical protein
LRLSMAERRLGRPRSHSISVPAVPGGRLKPGFYHPVPWFFQVFSHQIQCFVECFPHQNQVGSKKKMFSSLLGWCTGNLQQTIGFLQTIGVLQVFPAKIWMILCIYVYKYIYIQYISIYSFP